MILLSQNDARWKLKKLGFGNETIGSVGCLLTCYAMLWDADPIQVNEWFKKNECFVNLNLVYWVKTPGFIWRGWSYDNDEVKKAIEKYGFCIVETDFNDNPKDGSHFVVAKGNGRIYDPWDGKEKPFNSYQTFYGYGVIDPSKNPLKGGNMSDDEISISKKTFEDLVSKASRFDQFVSAGYGSATEVKQLISELRKSIDDKSAALDSERARAEALRKDFNDLVAMVAVSLGTVQEVPQIKVRLDEVQKNLDELDDIQRAFAELELSSGKEKEELNAEVSRLRAMLKNEDVLSNAKMEEILAEIIRRLKNIIKRG